MARVGSLGRELAIARDSARLARGGVEMSVFWPLPCCFPSCLKLCLESSNMGRTRLLASLSRSLRVDEGWIKGYINLAMAILREFRSSASSTVLTTLLSGSDIVTIWPRAPVPFSYLDLVLIGAIEICQTTVRAGPTNTLLPMF
jgi:hypothetical protein